VDCEDLRSSVLETMWMLSMDDGLGGQASQGCRA
jgi:hypothetical protein